MKSFDILPYALPNSNAGEIYFEEPRDLSRVVLRFSGPVPKDLGLSYLRRDWPGIRYEEVRDLENPCGFGWIPSDDWFNTKWQKGAVRSELQSKGTVSMTFDRLVAEFPDMTRYNVAFRRSLGVKIDTGDIGRLRKVEIYTASPPAATTLRVSLDAGRRTRCKKVELEGYNAAIGTVRGIGGCSVREGAVHRTGKGGAAFEVDVLHMAPSHRHSHDDGLVSFLLDGKRFTLSLVSLEQEGPVWFEEEGVYVRNGSHASIDFDDYRGKAELTRTIGDRVRERPEQSYRSAFFGQPRPHAVNYNLGCKHNRHGFFLEANGDVIVHKHNVTRIPGKDTPRFKCKGHGRFMFGLERWSTVSRFPDPSPVLVYNLYCRKGDLLLLQKSLSVPLSKSILDGELEGDDTGVGLFRFRFHNAGEKRVAAELPVNYSQDFWRTWNSMDPGPERRLDDIEIRGNRILGPWEGGQVLRAVVETTMKPARKDRGVVFSRKLDRGESCELLLKIPFIAVDTREEIEALEGLNFDKCHNEVTAFWRREAAKGAQIQSPEPHLDSLHKAHVAHVQITDFKMPDGSGLVNTSVGTSTYGNFSNESCMIIQDLDQRGLKEEAERRLGIWVKYQGTVPQPGNFTDFDGMYFGAGGFEEGAYNQHHGWILWALSEHFLLTGDKKWFRRVADSVIAGADWVFRQRRNTMGKLPHSRGWERGFLPAGSLEDVIDFHYWLSTNCLTWRGADSAARALETIGHPEAVRVRKEADDYRRDLIRGFETMCSHSPLVRLRNGRWVPQYPSRLYRRGRDAGWIRQTLEGAIYLLISGLYDPSSTQAQWILDDFQDNLYIKPPYGYLIPDLEANWFCRGGFSIQPLLLAGLMPYLHRDEPEIYIWMFFNAWLSCYREEIGAMTEHPNPTLGYSNTAQFKPSDQANALMWLRYMYIFTDGDLLHFGRALPRQWFEDGNELVLRDVQTCFGKVSVEYRSSLREGAITAVARIPKASGSHPRVLVRFRHPEKAPIRSVQVNGRRHDRFDGVKGDVDVTGFAGRVVLEARY
jgi:hypothetical protein